jgi:hypothetical protein
MEVKNMETYKKEIPICPNCGSSQTEERWVQEPLVKTKPKPISFEEYAQKQEPIPLFSSGDICTMRRNVQFVVVCSDCGYTVVKNLPDKKEAA